MPDRDPAPRAASGRITVWLDPSIAQMLRLWDPDKRDGYLTEVIRARWATWRAALEMLRSRGWTRIELLAACDALNGVWLTWEAEPIIPRGPSMAVKLRDAQDVNATATRHGVEHDSWNRRVKEVRSDETVAYSLFCVVCEWWAGNPLCDELIERLDNGNGVVDET